MWTDPPHIGWDRSEVVHYSFSRGDVAFPSSSLIIPMWDEILTVDSVTMAVNYGLNKVRFTNPVPAEGRVRLNATLQSVEELPKGGVQVTIDGKIELEGSERPAVVVEAVYRFFE